MTRRLFDRLMLAWLALTVLVGVGAGVRAHVAEPLPWPEAWGPAAHAHLEALVAGATAAPALPEGLRALDAQPLVLTAWRDGALVGRATTRGRYGDVIADAAARLRDTLGGREASRYLIEVGLGEAGLALGIERFENIGLAPIRDGVLARLGTHGEAVLSPVELQLQRGYEGGLAIPVPDVPVGVRLPDIVDQLSRELGTEAEVLRADGVIRRVPFRALRPAPFPAAPLDAERTALRAAAAAGAAFLLRHQQSGGRYTYIYDAATNGELPAGYNLPRHAGTTYFLAQWARYANDPEARRGAIAALVYLRRTAWRRCGEHRCIGQSRIADVGSAALALVAASEVLAGGENRIARLLVDELSAFLRAQQRPDGELMHEYDLQEGHPNDVQHLFYSGEAAFALLRAHRVTGNDDDLEAARRLLDHLTGAGWDFFGSRYYYGEEHWTCIAVAEARDRLDTTRGFDFCRRWGDWSHQIQYDADNHPLPIAGAFGVGPFLAPVLTAVGSRTEAHIGIEELYEHHGVDDRQRARLQETIEAGLEVLMRWQWRPGPIERFADPAGASGGMPSHPLANHSRNDDVQHAGSAWVRWLEVLDHRAASASAHGGATP